MKFIKGSQISTSEFWYDLFDGGYIDPENLLESEEDVKQVRRAMQVLQQFYNEAEEQGVLELI
jgi:hypothetical protein